MHCIRCGKKLVEVDSQVTGSAIPATSLKHVPTCDECWADEPLVGRMLRPAAEALLDMHVAIHLASARVEYAIQDMEDMGVGKERILTTLLPLIRQLPSAERDTVLAYIEQQEEF